MKYFFNQIQTPVSKLTLVSDGENLVAIHWGNDKPKFAKGDELQKDVAHPVLKKAQKQIEEYFRGERTDFDLPLKFSTGTEFQRKVWKQLAKIPFGKTSSYADLAKKVGYPKAFRAVGAANGKNPLSIVLPCHRVIGSNGKLVGFAQGLKSKKFLLDFESRQNCLKRA